MKIAVITDDGETISQHFGHASYYQVLTIEGGDIIDREMRLNMGVQQFSSQPHSTITEGSGHGMGAASGNTHNSMAQSIDDCQVLVCGGMGMSDYDNMRRLNIQPVVTEERDIQTAVQAYLDGRLIDQSELLR